MLGNLFAGKTFPPAALAAALMVMTVLSSGCARGPRLQSRSLLNDFSQFGQRDSDHAQEIVKRPSSAANSPVVAQADDASLGSAAQIDSGRASLTDPNEVQDHRSATAPDSDDEAPRSENLEDERVVARIVSSAEEGEDSRVRQLRAALSSDEERGHTHSSLGGTPPLRLRVDSLLRKAGDLLTAGKLVDARQSALRAAELTASAGLEFLPTEERPTDVLRQIDDQIELARQSDSATDVPAMVNPQQTSDHEATVLTLRGSSHLSHREDTLAALPEMPHSDDHPAMADEPPTQAFSDIELLPAVPADDDEPALPASPDGAAEPAGNGIRPFRGTVDPAESSSGPVLRVPNPPQIHEVGALPQFSQGETKAALATSGMAGLAPVTFALDDSLVWPIGGLIGIFVVFGAGLLIRSWIERVRTPS